MFSAVSPSLGSYIRNSSEGKNGMLSDNCRKAGVCVYRCCDLPVTVVLYMVRSLFIQSKKACNVFRIPCSLPFRTLLAQRSYTSFTELDWLEENYLLVML